MTLNPSSLDLPSIIELRCRAARRAWVEKYNHTHLHSALAYLPPMEYRVESLAVLA